MDKAIILRSWFENEFRAALLDDERIRLCVAVIKAGRDKGDEPMHVLRVAIASFVGELLAPDIANEIGDDWRARN